MYRYVRNLTLPHCHRTTPCVCNVCVCVYAYMYACAYIHTCKYIHIHTWPQ